MIGDRLAERFGDVVTSIEFSVNPRNADEEDFMRSLIVRLG